MGEDAVRPVEPLRLVLLEAALRQDLTGAEGDLLVALVAEAARERTSGTDRAGAAARDASGGPQGAADLRALAAAVPEGSVPASVRRAVRRALLPGRAGVGGLLATATVLWAQGPGTLRGQGVSVLLVAVAAVVSAGLLVVMHRSNVLAVDLGAVGSALTARARTVGALAERLLHATQAHPRPPSRLLVHLRARVHRGVLRIHAAALAAGVLVYTGLMRALGLL